MKLARKELIAFMEKYLKQCKEDEIKVLEIDGEPVYMENQDNAMGWFDTSYGLDKISDIIENMDEYKGARSFTTVYDNYLHFIKLKN